MRPVRIDVADGAVIACGGGGDVGEVNRTVLLAVSTVVFVVKVVRVVSGEVELDQIRTRRSSGIGRVGHEDRLPQGTGGRIRVVPVVPRGGHHKD